MALTFAAGSGDRVNHGGNSGTSMDDLPATAMTAWAWVYRTGSGGDQTVAAKRKSGTGGWLWRIDGTTTPVSMSMLIVRATVDAFRITADSAVAPAANAWSFVATTFDTTGGIQMFKGTLTSAVVQNTTWVAGETNGSGSVTTDATADLWVGNWEQVPTIAMEGRIERVGVIARVLTLAQLEALRLATIKDCNVANTVLLTDYRNGSAIDYSGSGNNGTITGATNSDGPWTSSLVAMQAPGRQLNQILGR